MARIVTFVIHPNQQNSLVCSDNASREFSLKDNLSTGLSISSAAVSESSDARISLTWILFKDKKNDGQWKKKRQN